MQIPDDSSLDIGSPSKKFTVDVSENFSKKIADAEAQGKDTHDVASFANAIAPDDDFTIAAALSGQMQEMQDDKSFNFLAPTAPETPSADSSSVARWMWEKLKEDKALDYNYAVYIIQKKFGSRFVQNNETRQITKEVKTEFKRLYKGKAKWNLRGKYWELQE